MPPETAPLKWLEGGKTTAGLAVALSAESAWAEVAFFRISGRFPASPNGSCKGDAGREDVGGAGVDGADVGGESGALGSAGANYSRGARRAAACVFSWP